MAVFATTNTNVKNVYTVHMRHIEIHAVVAIADLELAHDAGLIDAMHHLLFGPTCDECLQMILLEKNEKLFIVIGDADVSKISCTMCLTQTILAGIVGE